MTIWDWATANPISFMVLMVWWGVVVMVVGVAFSEREQE